MLTWHHYEIFAKLFDEVSALGSCLAYAMFFKQGSPGDYALNVGLNGLSHLYTFVKAKESERTKSPESKPILQIDFGSSDTNDVILNHFVWYSTTLAPFIGLFTRSYHPSEDLKQEFGNVIKWRNKVAAHFAWVDPRRDDTQMVEQASINQYVTWDADRYSVGREVIRKNYEPGTVPDSTPGDWGWELTDVHERLCTIIRHYV